jgi:hypothetical protein
MITAAQRLMAIKAQRAKFKEAGHVRSHCVRSHCSVAADADADAMDAS